MTGLRFPWDNERRVRALSEHGPGRPEVMGDIIADVEQLLDLVHDAWGVIANAGFQPGEEKTPGWHEAAVRWRDDMHDAMGITRTSGTEPTSAGTDAPP